MVAARRPLPYVVAGLLLIVAGLLSWRLGLDASVRQAFRLVAGSPEARAAVPLSATGGLIVQGPIAICACALLLAGRRWAEGAWLATTIVLGRLIVEAVKIAVARDRPPVVDRLELVTSWSFPSSHSAGAMMTALAVVLAFGGGPRWIAAAIAYAAVIGWSRLALGVHWPGDVLAGWGFGLAWIGLALTASPRARRAPA